jgi:hypothetical protein
LGITVSATQKDQFSTPVKDLTYVDRSFTMTLPKRPNGGELQTTQNSSPNPLANFSNLQKAWNNLTQTQTCGCPEICGIIRCYLALVWVLHNRLNQAILLAFP